MARVLSFLIRYFSNYYTLYRSDLAARAAPLDPRTQHRFDIHTTSITFKQRRKDVKTTSCAYRVVDQLGLSTWPLAWLAITLPLNCIVNWSTQNLNIYGKIFGKTMEIIIPERQLMLTSPNQLHIVLSAS